MYRMPSNHLHHNDNHFNQNNHLEYFLSEHTNSGVARIFPVEARGSCFLRGGGGGGTIFFPLSVLKFNIIRDLCGGHQGGTGNLSEGTCPHIYTPPHFIK